MVTDSPQQSIKASVAREEGGRRGRRGKGSGPEKLETPLRVPDAWVFTFGQSHSTPRHSIIWMCTCVCACVIPNE